MIDVEKVENGYKGLVKEMRFFAGDCLLDRGALIGLQMELAQKSFDPYYIQEKCNAVKRTMDGILHDLDIAIAIQEDEYPSMPKTP